MKVLVSGSAGFIGLFLVEKLLSEGHNVVGLDSINDYYDVNLKYARLKKCGIEESEVKDFELVQSTKFKDYSFVKMDLCDKFEMLKLFEKEKFDCVCNLAAQAGIRYSLENPDAYIKSNVVGFLNVLECCRAYPVKHLVYASSSSVYGLNQALPWSTHDAVDHPVSLYAATKKSNELMAHTYSHLYNIPTTGLRFFTVYGPWGRPDMAPILFAKNISEGKSIKVFNNGNMYRDFTYVEDIVDGVCKVITKPSLSNKDWDRINPDSASSSAPYKIYNIGNTKPVKLLNFIEELEKNLETSAIKEMLPLQPGDVEKTHADCTDLINDFGYKPKVSIESGVASFVSWYKDFYTR